MCLRRSLAVRENKPMPIDVYKQRRGCVPGYYRNIGLQTVMHPLIFPNFTDGEWKVPKDLTYSEYGESSTDNHKYRERCPHRHERTNKRHKKLQKIIYVDRTHAGSHCKFLRYCAAVRARDSIPFLRK